VSCNTDTLFMNCHYDCGFKIEAKVAHNAVMPPSTIERWHLRMAKHVRREHMAKR
jgi:hypothetical protein